MRNILMVPSWYPTRHNPFNGDFIQRYANCISLVENVIVLYCEKDKNILQKEVITRQVNARLTEIIIYYPHGPSESAYQKTISTIRYLAALKSQYDEIRKTVSFDLVHVQVAYKAGLFAMLLKELYGLPYLLTEHRSYFLQTSGGFGDRSWFERTITKKIFNNAAGVHLVSNAMKQSMQQWKLNHTNTFVIPNVVNTELFQPQYHHDETIVRFVHVSSLIAQKNVEGMLRAIKLAAQIRTDFTLRIVGPATDLLIKLSMELGLQNMVQFTGAVSYPEVAKEVASSAAMIFFTRFESFGCVIAESLCCGVPVIISDLEVTRELITDGDNGILVTSENEQELAAAILHFVQNCGSFQRSEIARNAAVRFKYESVAPIFCDVYSKILKR